MKQVVISKTGSVLNLYWFLKYMSMKGIKLYPYKEIYNDDYEIIRYEIIDNPEKNDWKYNSWCRLDLLTNNYGKILLKDEFEKHKKEIVYHFDYLENREDVDLINIAKEINDKNILKIVEIPDDVLYEVQDCECSVGEMIVEKHREWY